MSIEQRFEVSLIAAMALREKQIQQNYRPIIGIHKWFARRPGTLFRGLILAEFGDAPLEEAFFRANDLPGIRIADPFMGGGTPLIEANRVGCDVQGFDVNPMSAWIVREEVQDIDLLRYQATAETLIDTLKKKSAAIIVPIVRCMETVTFRSNLFSGSRCSIVEVADGKSIYFPATFLHRTGGMQGTCSSVLNAMT